MRWMFGVLLTAALCCPAWAHGHRGGCSHHSNKGQGCANCEQCRNGDGSGRRMGRGRQAPQNAPAPPANPSPQK
jgi:hypothetical protein